ncbi:MAG TPA: type II toxin-antitoxin system VapC family toxin [Longimicrobium sp.]|nr:type II toxin-antitoxin system VapC family toxin [Longimicrobium sp.]
MPLFLDACALAKRYLHEGKSSTTMKAVTGRPERWGGLFVSSFVEIEVVSSIAKAAREYGNPYGRADALKAVSRTVGGFLNEYRGGAFNIVELNPRLMGSSINQLREHPEMNIGAGDAIHLATALQIVRDTGAGLVFATADQGLYEAARKEGLKVFNPNFEDEHRLSRIVNT